MNVDLRNILKNEAKQLENYTISLYQKIHMYPETAFEEEKTCSLIRNELHALGIETIPAARTGLIATIKGNEPGKTIALRADIDALDIKEENNIFYKSQLTGKMHACGHDAHTAMLITAAKVLNTNRDKIQGTIKLIFQPAEENGSGAKIIIQEGHLNNVDVIFGLHVWSPWESGKTVLIKGPVFAAADRMVIRVSGQGGHAATPHLTIDPTSVLVDIYNAIQKIISREVDPFKQAVISTPKFKGSNAQNIIPSIAELEGTVRTFDKNLRDFILKRILEITAGYAQAWRCKGEVIFDINNDPVLLNNDIIIDKLSAIFENYEFSYSPAALGSEDFSFYLEKCPGAYIILGSKNPTKNCIYPHHHPQFQVDESILWQGTWLYSLMGCFSSFL